MSPRGNPTIAARRLRCFWWCLFLFLLGSSSWVQAEEHDKNRSLLRESQYEVLPDEGSAIRLLEDDQTKAAPTDETPDISLEDGDQKKATTSSPTAAPTKKKKKGKKSTDSCSSATTCEDCLQLSAEFKANHTISEDQVCMWHDGKCTTVSSEEYPKADRMCETSKDQQQPPATDEPDEMEGTTNSPTRTPTADKKEKTTPSPTKALKTESPTPAPVKTTSSPTKAPTAPKTITKQPTKAPTPEPTNSPTKVAVPATEPPTNAPTPEPTKSSTPAPQTTLAPTSEAEERGGALLAFSKLLFGVVLLIFMFYCYNRRKFTGHRHHHYGDVSGPRYEGVSTREKDDEDDWDWDDDGGGGDVELGAGGISSKNHTNTTKTATTRPSSYQQPLYRDQPRPRAGRHDSLKRRSNSGDGSNESPSPPPKPSPKKQQPLKMPPPKSDDIFAEMGFSAKPTFGKATTVNRSLVPAPPVHGLGAVHLPPDDDDDDGDNWGDDADLDDLLND